MHIGDDIYSGPTAFQPAVPVENIEDFGFARGYTYALDYWKEILDGLNALRNERGMMSAAGGWCLRTAPPSYG
jgi:hypothetical protein